MDLLFDYILQMIQKRIEHQYELLDDTLDAFDSFHAKQIMSLYYFPQFLIGGNLYSRLAMSYEMLEPYDKGNRTHDGFVKVIHKKCASITVESMKQVDVTLPKELKQSLKEATSELFHDEYMRVMDALLRQAHMFDIVTEVESQKVLDFCVNHSSLTPESVLFSFPEIRDHLYVEAAEEFSEAYGMSNPLAN